MYDFRGRAGLPYGVLPLILMVILTTSVAAQGVVTSGPSGVPGFGGGVNASTWCPPAGTVCGPVAVYAGWGSDRRGATLSFDIQRPDTEDLLAMHHSYPVRGLWLGLAAEGKVKNQLGVLLDGWVMVPSNSISEESISILGVPTTGKKWSARTNWWFADGALAAGYGRGQVLAGFRFDRFATNFQDPESFSGITGLPSDRSDVTMNGYIPFVGYQLQQDSPHVSRLKIRVIGFPWFSADMKYHDTVGGIGVVLQDRIELRKVASGKYFVEAFAEYERNIVRNGTVGLFARWNAFHAASSRVNIKDVLDGTRLTGEYRFGFNRQSWTVGAGFRMAFTTPCSIR